MAELIIILEEKIGEILIETNFQKKSSHLREVFQGTAGLKAVLVHGPVLEVLLRREYLVT